MGIPSSPSGVGRVRLWLIVAALWVGFCATGPGLRARAQDEAAPAAADAEPAAEPEAEPAPAVPAAAPAGVPTESGRQQSLLGWLARASGIVGFTIVLLSVYFVALVIRLWIEFSMKEAVPPALIAKLETAIQERKFQDAYDACRDSNSFLARLVRTGVANLPNGRAEAKEAMNLMTEEIVVGMEQKISYIAVVGTLGPMLGLLGTVWGMILAFLTIANSGSTQVQPAKLADNIGTALVTTLEGLVVAIPAIFFFAWFRNRIATIAMEATRVADRTIAAFYTAARQPGSTKPTV
jgi:biopolymer transport protein ExbB